MGKQILLLRPLWIIPKHNISENMLKSVIICYFHPKRLNSGKNPSCEWWYSGIADRLHTINK